MRTDKDAYELGYMTVCHFYYYYQDKEEEAEEEEHCPLNNCAKVTATRTATNDDEYYEAVCIKQKKTREM
jgi:hypothetical protein